MKTVRIHVSRLVVLTLVFFAAISCITDDREAEVPQQDLKYYYPPLSGNNWEVVDASEAGFNLDGLESLYEMLESTGTRGFIILKDGKIVIEKYFGQQLTSDKDFGETSLWYWASAGKTLTATLVGIANQEEKLNLGQPTSSILGNGWTSLAPEQEQKIILRNHLSMTTGLDDGVEGNDEFLPSKLQYKAEPGQRWAYHNAPYTILDNVIEKSTTNFFAQYFNLKIASKIGMLGSWQRLGTNQVFFSNTRSMARFGHLILSDGDWAGQEILADKEYLRQMLSPSQEHNSSYGYFWWLNGQPSYMLPGVESKINGMIVPNAPSDMVAGIGEDGQYLCVVPSMDLVMVRLGQGPEDINLPFTLLNAIWGEMENILPIQ